MYTNDHKRDKKHVTIYSGRCSTLVCTDTQCIHVECEQGEGAGPLAPPLDLPLRRNDPESIL